MTHCGLQVMISIGGSGGGGVPGALHVHNSRRACMQDLSLAALHPHFKVQLDFQVPTIQGTNNLQLRWEPKA